MCACVLKSFKKIIYFFIIIFFKFINFFKFFMFIFLCRKRSLWLEHPTLKFCYFLTHVHSMMLEFLRSVSCDHSILLDFLISAETATFVEYLTDYLSICVMDWSDLCRACAEVDSYQATNDISHKAIRIVNSMF